MRENREKAKAYLRDIQRQKKRLEYKSAEIIRLRLTAQSVRTTLSEDAGSNHSGDSLGRIISKLLDAEAEYKADMERYLDAEREAIGFLDRITAERANVLYLYYFQGLTWERIAEKIHYSCQWTFAIGCRALDELYDILRLEEKI